MPRVVCARFEYIVLECCVTNATKCVWYLKQYYKNQQRTKRSNFDCYIIGQLPIPSFVPFARH